MSETAREAYRSDSVNRTSGVFLARPPFTLFAGLFGYEQLLNLVVSEIQAWVRQHSISLVCELFICGNYHSPSHAALP